eukprot:CAMPEP_0176116944 /NCGR_PEP_ID=MMETSP0120_2-20121206/58747_1 /TAXON_ID=160619 /ORGANISM="Kryptoperidinium foliaceum, Strain CCMP 1326" /LENGTH=73 /DNA_ID=CAMNT_0017451227 /DNA_START=124 /DNA_END=342 /DNA_ORIENTATION=-
MTRFARGAAPPVAAAPSSVRGTFPRAVACPPTLRDLPRPPGASARGGRAFGCDGPPDKSCGCDAAGRRLRPVA